jgi:hypothetical protein
MGRVGVKLALIIAGVAGLLSGFPAEAGAETLPSIREFCQLRFPGNPGGRSGCEASQSRAARKLLDLLEDVERDSPAFNASRHCIERARLKKIEKKVLIKLPVNWNSALKCVESYFENHTEP